MNSRKAHIYINNKFAEMGRPTVEWSTFKQWQMLGKLGIGSVTPAKAKDGRRYSYTVKELDAWLETQRPVKRVTVKKPHPPIVSSSLQTGTITNVTADLEGGIEAALKERVSEPATGTIKVTK